MESAAAAKRAYGDARVLVPAPHVPQFPEGIAVRGNRVYVAGPATFGTTGKGPSQVRAFNVVTGALVASYPTQGENLLMEHADSSIAFDASGRLYVLNTQLGLYRLYPDTGVQEPYSTPFPDLHPCVPIVIPPPCSPTLIDGPPIPNDLAFDDGGNAYVTDSLQATIWRVPRGGGQPQIWFQDQRLASPYIGVNGIRLSPDRKFVYVSVSQDLSNQSTLYRLPLLKTPPLPAQLEVFHRYPDGQLPDGFAFGASGRLYVTIARPSDSGVSVLGPDGTELVRLRNPLLSPIAPYDSPANIAFNGRGSILLTNHAFATGVLLPQQFTVIDVFVDDRASPLVEPVLP